MMNFTLNFSLLKLASGVLHVSPVSMPKLDILHWYMVLAPLSIGQKSRLRLDDFFLSAEQKKKSEPIFGLEKNSNPSFSPETSSRRVNSFCFESRDVTISEAWLSARIIKPGPNPIKKLQRKILLYAGMLTNQRD